MKKYFLLLFALAAFCTAIAQQDTTALYLQFPDVPPFTIQTAPDSSTFVKADLKKRKPVLIMLFSPDCDHCTHQTKLLKTDIALLKDVQIVMVSFLNFDLIKKFYEDFNLANYSSISVGRDGKFFLGTFYKLHTYPSMFLYNKKGKFVQHFEGNVEIKKIAEALRL